MDRRIFNRIANYEWLYLRRTSCTILATFATHRNTAIQPQQQHSVYHTASIEKPKKKMSAHAHDRSIYPNSQKTALCIRSCLAHHTFCVRKVPMIASPLPRLRIFACQRLTPPPLCEPAHVTPMYLKRASIVGVREVTSLLTYYCRKRSGHLNNSHIVFQTGCARG